MKFIIDRQIAKNFQQDLPISWRWPTFLESKDLGSLFPLLPEFEPAEPLRILHEGDREQIIYLYDCLFAEVLGQIKDLSELKIALPEKTTRHDLILYLGWERVCMLISQVFDYQSTDPKLIQGLEVLKECLIETYLHLVKDGKTTPSLFRLLETLFFYEMREENLHKHTEEEWTVLNQAFPLFKEGLADFFYIDDMDDEEAVYLTSELEDQVNTRLAFAHCMVSKLKREIPSWPIEIKPKKITYGFTNF